VASWEQGDLPGARPLLERALSIREHRLGVDHPATAWNLASLALMLEAQCDLAGARALHERAVAIRYARLARSAAATTTAAHRLAAQLTTAETAIRDPAETAIRDPATPASKLPTLDRTQQRAYRALVRHPRLVPKVLALLAATAAALTAPGSPDPAAGADSPTAPAPAARGCGTGWRRSGWPGR
jgi:hypothetical protein